MRVRLILQLAFSCFFGLTVGYSQSKGSILVLSNIDAVISLDGKIVGNITSNKPLAVAATTGDHLIMAKSLSDSLVFETMQVLGVESEMQKVVKFEFSVQDLKTTQVADFDFFAPGLETVWEWKEKNVNMLFTDQPIFYFAFEKKDEITIDLDLSKGVYSTSFIVTKYPENKLVMGLTSIGELKGLKLSITENGIYKFIIISDNFYDGIVHLRMIRKPANKVTQDFVTSVVKTKVYKPVKILSPVIIQFKEGEKSKRVPVKLPPQTSEWYYQCINNKNTPATDLLSQLDKLTNGLRIFPPDSLSGISVNMLDTKAGSDSCMVYVLDKKNAKLFGKQKRKDQTAFQSLKTEDTQGIGKVSEVKDSLYWIGVLNSDKGAKNVILEAVALTYKNDYVIGTVQISNENAVIKLRRAVYIKKIVGNVKSNKHLLPIEYRYLNGN